MLSYSKSAAIAAGVLCSVAAWAQQAPEKRLSARELFYAAAERPAAAPAATAQKPASTTARNTSPKPARTSAQAAAKKAPEPASRVPEPTPAAGAQVVNAVYESSAATTRRDAPLGLRYTLLKRVEGQMIEVAPDAVFHAGDRIQVSVQTNDAGFLYLIHQGSSGTWKPLFPSAEVEEGNNRVEKGRTYVMPPGSRFYFDEQAGEEKLFVVLSREPVADLEKIIYSLQGGGKAAPAGEPQPAPQRKLLYAANMPPIDDAVVGRLRNVYARDLVIERVDDDAPGPRKEKAVYVVNPNGSADSRVVADISVIHK